MFSKTAIASVRSPSVTAGSNFRPVGDTLRFLRHGTIMLSLMTGAASVHADTVSINAFKDATIFGTSDGADTGNASGMGPGLFTGTDGQLNDKRSLVQFDLAAANIPAGSQIDNVTMSLSLGLVGGGAGVPQTVQLFDIAQTWSEGSSGSPTSSSLPGSGQGYPRGNGDSTWDYANYNSDPASAIKWQNGGSDLPGGNFSPIESASAAFTTFTPGSVHTWSSAAMAADVQDWLDNPSQNNGWLLKSDEEGVRQSLLGFWSQDGAMAAGDTALAPKLEIIYSPIPEPETYAMLFAGLGLLGWRMHRVKSELG
ncbi:DNRLRE domain-containing protein [Nitrosovibrio sp. Nv4]|uniref:DNRLRE domain-containing protein n=1 Tax=Nitrosovibrio sp. Nv4 TaxID=1945880 RepID=UPI000BDB7B8B|nr:DNRLRE domain-containing protein [Nitrosovibrio sp. Nv4]SOD41925.1 PEP-CTERM protein-sorting domain-containing protein [Nitrosovibrio sp. Nv4]